MNYRSHRSRTGFTMMELLIALAIITLLMGGGFALTRNLRAEEKIARPVGEITTLAKRAWMRAMAEQRSWQIRMSANQLVLEPKQPLMAADATMMAAVDQKLERKSGVEIITLEEGVRLEVMLWADQRPRPPRPDAWIFEGSGLCEPITIRLIFDEKNAVSLRFDPLTAGVQEQSFETLQ